MSGLKNVQPLEDLNWDEFENSTDVNANKEDLTKVYDETLSRVGEHQVTGGTIIALDRKKVIVDIDYKSDRIIPASEFRYNPDLKIGDKVEVYVKNQEDKKGQLVLSHKKARLTESWDRINSTLDNDEIIQGCIKSRTKGGMIADMFSIKAFLSGSQVDVHPIRDYNVLVGRTMEFKVVKINREFRNIVASYKALIEAELGAQKKEIISKLEKGQIFEGIVKNITLYGVFANSGGVDRLVYITGLSWGRISDPREVVSLNEKINMAILDFDDEKKHVALGLKQLAPHPWDALGENLKVGDKAKGRVVAMAGYDAFIGTASGVEGLIHVSEMSWGQHLHSAQDFIYVGDEIEAVILILDREDRKMSLGIEQLKADPWEDIEVKYPVGSKHTAKVRNFTNFGIFVELEEGADGLIHISDLSWTKKIEHPSEFTTVSAAIDVVISGIDEENRRLSLGHKQLEENPWDTYETIHTPSSIHTGEVTKMVDGGAVITLNEDGESFATSKHLVREDRTQAQQGKKLGFRVIEFIKETKRIILSYSHTFEDMKDDVEPIRRHSTTQKSNDIPQISNVTAGTSLGNSDVLAKLKADMEKGE